MILRYLLIVLSIYGLATQSLFATSLGNHNKKFTHPRDMLEEDWSHPDELERTWKSAIVRIPTTKGKYRSSTMRDLPADDETHKRYPTIIYLHGCSGIWKGTYMRLNFYAESGFAVIAPVSFARSKYPQSCDVYFGKSGLYRETLRMRQNDAHHAITRAIQLPWVDPDNIFLAGLSEGGITAATYSAEGAQSKVKGRIIEGWTCHAGWHEYRGINALPHEPVLSLVGEKEPWFQTDWTRGDCGAFMMNRNSKSVVFRDGYLSTRHELLEDKKVQKIVLEFLEKNTH